MMKATAQTYLAFGWGFCLLRQLKSAFATSQSICDWVNGAN